MQARTKGGAVLSAFLLLPTAFFLWVAGMFLFLPIDSQHPREGLWFRCCGVLTFLGFALACASPLFSRIEASLRTRSDRSLLRCCPECGATKQTIEEVCDVCSFSVGAYEQLTVAAEDGFVRVLWHLLCFLWGFFAGGYVLSSALALVPEAPLRFAVFGSMGLLLWVGAVDQLVSMVRLWRATRDVGPSVVLRRKVERAGEQVSTELSIRRTPTGFVREGRRCVSVDESAALLPSIEREHGAVVRESLEWLLRERWCALRYTAQESWTVVHSDCATQNEGPYRSVGNDVPNEVERSKREQWLISVLDRRLFPLIEASCNARQSELREEMESGTFIAWSLESLLPLLRTGEVLACEVENKLAVERASR